MHESRCACLSIVVLFGCAMLVPLTACSRSTIPLTQSRNPAAHSEEPSWSSSASAELTGAERDPYLSDHHNEIAAAFERTMKSYHGRHLDQIKTTYEEYSQTPGESLPTDWFQEFRVAYTLDGVQFLETEVGREELTLTPSSEWAARFRQDQEFGSQDRFYRLLAHVRHDVRVESGRFYLFQLWDEEFKDFGDVSMYDTETSKLARLIPRSLDVVAIGEGRTVGGELTYPARAIYYAHKGSSAWRLLTMLKLDTHGMPVPFSAGQLSRIETILGVR